LRDRFSDWPLAVWLVPASAATIAVLPLPYGYYQLLRVVIFVTCGLLACASFQNTRLMAFVVALASVAVLFNPFAPVHLTKATWALFDLGAAAVLIAHLALARGWKRDP